MAKGCLEVAKRRKEKVKRGARRGGEEKSLFMRLARALVSSSSEGTTARWIRLLGGVVERREGFREEERVHERMKGHPRGPPACSV